VVFRVSFRRKKNIGVNQTYPRCYGMKLEGSEVQPGGSTSRVTILAFPRNHPYLFAISRSDIPVIYDIRIFSLIKVGRIPMLRR
jgi:hypothetical protein